ncbi:MAG: RluA family pseudouridine synthase [Bacteroidales bacterium]
MDSQNENTENIEEIENTEEIENEFFEHFRIEIDKGQSPLRIDKFLMDRIINTTRNKIQNAACSGNILVNGKTVKPNYRVRPLDIVSIVLAHPPRETEITPEDIPLDIVYEDSEVLVVNKAPNMVVHPGFGNFQGTLLNALTFYLQKNAQKGQTGKPYLVHRIDKNTSGLLLIAKTEIAQSYLAKQFYEHSVERKYYALVWGDFKEDEGTIEGNIGRSIKDRKVMSVFPNGEMGRSAITHYKVVERFGYVTLIECVLETGRTHQIRAHLKYLKHPLFNDETYGGDQILKGTTFSKYKQFIQNCFKLMPRQGLHAATLGFVHPTTHQFMRFENTIPKDMSMVLDKWRSYIVNKEYEEDLPLEPTSEEKIMNARLLNENN